MNTTRVILARTTGALCALLGVVHCAATPFVLAEPGFSSLDADAVMTFTVMFLGTGLAVLWCGLAFLLAAVPLGRGDAWPRPVLALAAAFLVTLSIPCVVAMPSNPFAWAALATAILGAYVPLGAGRRAAPVTPTEDLSEATP